MGEGWSIAMAGEPVRAAATGAPLLARLREIVRLLERPGMDPRGVSAAVDGSRIVARLGPLGDPFRTVMVAGLQPRSPPLRWAIVAGPGRGARSSAGRVTVRLAHERLDAAARSRDRIVVATGSDRTDSILADLGAALPALLANLTERQRDVGRLLLVEGLRQSDVATRLGVSRPTVSVMVDRARLVELQRLSEGLAAILRGSLERSSGGN